MDCTRAYAVHPSPPPLLLLHLLLRKPPSHPSCRPSPTPPPQHTCPSFPNGVAASPITPTPLVLLPPPSHPPLVIDDVAASPHHTHPSFPMALVLPCRHALEFHRMCEFLAERSAPVLMLKFFAQVGPGAWMRPPQAAQGACAHAGCVHAHPPPPPPSLPPVRRPHRCSADHHPCRVEPFL